MTKIIKAYSNNHLGDNIINMIFFYKLKDYIESNDIKIIYRCQEQYIKNLKDFNVSDNIIILPFDDIVHNDEYLLWQGNDPNHSNKNIEQTLCDMFNNFLIKNNIPISVDKFEYEDNDLLVRYKNIISNNDNYKNIEILVINSIPNSGQFTFNQEDFDDFLVKLSQKYKIATSKKVNDDIISLEDYSVKDIAAISTNVDIIIAINTGPSIPLYNKYTLDRVQKIYLLDHNSYPFNIRKVLRIKKINEINFLLEPNVENFDVKNNYEYNDLFYLLFIIITLFLVYIFYINYKFLSKKIKKINLF
jgi:hypothetical protein